MSYPIDTFYKPGRRLRDLDTAHVLLLTEALITLAASSAAIALLPFRRVVRLASPVRSPGRRSRRARFGVDELGWAIEAIAWRVPWRTVCFQKGLTLHLMLHRRGIASILHYGVGTDDDGALKAHVWISVDGDIVQGGGVADRFHCLATYPTGE